MKPIIIPFTTNRTTNQLITWLILEVTFCIITIPPVVEYIRSNYKTK